MGVSTQPQQYVVVPAASNGPLVAYGNPQDLSQFAQPVMPFQQVSGNQVAALGFLGRQAPAPVVAEEDTDPEFVQELQQLFILVLRLGTCSLMVHHGFDKIQNVDGFSANVVAKFFGFLPGPPQFWTLSAASTPEGRLSRLASQRRTPTTSSLRLCTFWCSGISRCQALASILSMSRSSEARSIFTG